MHPSQVCPAGQEETFHLPKLHDELVLKHDPGDSNDIITSFYFEKWLNEIVSRLRFYCSFQQVLGLDVIEQ